MALSPRESGAIALNTALGVIILCIVSARLWTRHVLQKTIEAEDILILLSTISTIGALVATVLAVFIFKYGLHTWQLSIPELVRAGWLLFVAEFAYIIISSMIKLAILLFYLRLGRAKIGLGGKIFRWTIYAFMVEIMIYRIIYVIIMCTACTPLRARWLRVDPVWMESHHFTCPTNDALNIMVGSAVSAGEDLVLALLPAVLVWSMQIPTRTKIGIWLLFSLSIGTSSLGFLRAYMMYQAFYFGQKDWIYHLYWTWLLAMFEVACGLICSSVPALKPFFKHFKVEQKVKGFFKLSSGKSNTTTADLSPGHTTLVRNAREDPASIVYDGAMWRTSVAEVTWTSRPKSGIRSSWTRKSHTRKSSEIIVEEEVHELEDLEGNQRDSMWINVCQSVTVDREISCISHGAYMPYGDGSMLSLDDIVLEKYPD